MCRKNGQTKLQCNVLFILCYQCFKIIKCYVLQCDNALVAKIISKYKQAGYSIVTLQCYNQRSLVF